MATSDTAAHPPAHQEFSLADSVMELLSNQAHDRKRRKAELEGVDMDAASHDSKEADLVSFTDAMLSHPFLLQSLSAREIVNLKCVCKLWAGSWIPDNITAIANARRQVNSRDWYFPVIAELDLRTPASSPQPQLLLSGIWHATADQSSGKLLRACPMLDYLPPAPPHCRTPQYDIMASSDGLLLVKGLSVSLMAPDHEQRKLHGKAYKCCYRCKDFTLGKKWDWESLTVINPLTKQFRVLPTFAGESQGWAAMHCHGAQAQIMVDHEANSYKVLYYKWTWRFVYVYESQSDSWRCVCYSHTPLRPELGSYCTSAKPRGRLHFADIREATATETRRNSTVGGVLRLFEIDIGTGQWSPSNDFPLCKWPDQNIQDLGVTPYFDFEKNVLRNLELVECMGHMYAVIPARLDENLQPLHSMRPRLWNRKPSAVEFEYIMALQFYIFQLEGEDLHCGVLRIEIPRNTKTCKDKRQQSLYEKTWAREPAEMDPGRNWFSCTAKGSVIWVSCEDYLLQYDVESGQSKTQLLPKRRMQRCDQQMRLAYRASFHMKP